MLQLRPPKEEREAISRDDPMPSVLSTVAAEPVGPGAAVPSDTDLHRFGSSAKVSGVVRESRPFARAFRTASLPQRLVVAAMVGYAAVFSVVAVYGRPSLGIGQGFYVPVVLAALATGPVIGALAGFAAIVLYDVALLLNGSVTSSAIAANTPIRLVSYVLAGATVGYFATQGRRMLADSLHILDEMLDLTRRDLVTASLTSEGLEQSINQRIAAKHPFGLLVGETVGRRTHDDELRRTARLLSAQLHPDDQLARLGPSRFAILVASRSPGRARQTSEHLERTLQSEDAPITFGWAVYPQEGREALELFSAAVDRLQARRLIRGEWEPTAASAELVDELPSARFATE
jgi:GGDEF domain-containing protein